MKKSHALSACHNGSLFMCPSFSCQCIKASIPFQEGLFPIMWTEGMCCSCARKGQCCGYCVHQVIVISGGISCSGGESGCSLVSLSLHCILLPWLIVAPKGSKAQLVDCSNCSSPSHFPSPMFSRTPVRCRALL